MLKKATADLKGIKVYDFDGLVVDYARGASYDQGLRMLFDFEYEFQMALTNRKLSPEMKPSSLCPMNLTVIFPQNFEGSSFFRRRPVLFVPSFVEGS